MAFIYHRKYLGVLLLILLAVAALSGCGGDEGQASEESIQLTASPASVPLMTYTTITAVVRNSVGALAAGEMVSFTTDLGAFPNDAGDPVLGAKSIPADINGIATVQLYSGQIPGTAKVNCSALSIGQTIEVVFTEDFPQVDYMMELTASPAAISGGGASLITAVVTTTYGMPVSGVGVSFVTNLGSFEPVEDDGDADDGDGEEEPVTPAATAPVTFITVTTDVEGVATVPLYHAGEGGTATVTCSALGITESVKVILKDTESMDSKALSSSNASIHPVLLGAPVQSGETAILPLRIVFMENGEFSPNKVLSLSAKSIDQPQSTVFLHPADAMTGQNGAVDVTLSYPAALSGKDEVTIFAEIDKGNAANTTLETTLDLP